MDKRHIWKRITWLIAIVMLSGLVLAACGDDEDDPTATAESPAGQTEATPAEDESEDEPTEEADEGEPTEASTGDDTDLESLEGRVNIDGSSTVFPVTQAMAEEFNLVAPNVQVPVGVSGTGGGFEKFCAGETDISDASRPIKAEEAEICAEAGIEFIEIPVAYDGLSVVVNPENDWVTCLTVDELNTMWAPESEGEITTWNQINPDFPDAELVLFGPGTDSGTYDYFTDVVNGEEGASRGDFTGSEDDNVLVQGVSSDVNALGFFGYSYYEENQDSLKLVAIDDGDDSNGEGCVEPSPETINDGTYQPLSRPLFIYVNSEAAQRAEVSAFVDFYLLEGPTLIPEIGYVPFSEEFYATLYQRYADGRTGSVFADGGSSQGVTVNDLLFEDERGMSGNTDDAEPTGTADDTADEDIDYGSLSGRINIDGSSTVFPVTQAMAEEFNLVASGVQVPVGVSGTGGGFEKFCAAETDISDASRPIKAEEAEICAEAGIEFIEIPVAFDGLSIVVNPENDWVTCLTVDELNTMWAPESEGEITSWNQVNPDFPDEPLTLYGPGTDSGTYDYFTDVVNGEEGASRGDFTGSEDDNVLVQGVASDVSALGFFGYSYYEENQDSLKLVAIDDGDDSNGEGCVEPSPETINDGTYQPLSRPIFIYVNAEAAQRPEVTAFVDFYLNEGPTIIPEIGYVPFSEDLYSTLYSRFEAGTTGSVFGGGSSQGVTVDDLLFEDER